MKYVLNVFSPETHPKFTSSGRNIAGFRVRHRQAAEHLSPGDLIACYLTRLSRWVGLLEVVGAPFVDVAPPFVDQDDPFVCFRIEQRGRQRAQTQALRHARSTCTAGEDARALLPVATFPRPPRYPSA